MPCVILMNDWSTGQCIEIPRKFRCDGGSAKFWGSSPPQEPPVVPSLLEVSKALGCDRRQGCHQIREFKENQGILFSIRGKIRG